MPKVKKIFQFNYELKHTVVRDLRIVKETVGFLTVECVGYFNKNASPIDAIYDRYAVDIEFVRWEGADIKPVLEVTGSMDEIEESAVRYFANLLTDSIAA